MGEISDHCILILKQMTSQCFLINLTILWFPYTYNFVVRETFHLNTRHENVCLLSGLLRCSVDNQFIFVEGY